MRNYRLTNITPGSAEVLDTNGNYRGLVQRIEWIAGSTVIPAHAYDGLGNGSDSHIVHKVETRWEARRPGREADLNDNFGAFDTRDEAATSLL